MSLHKKRRYLISVCIIIHSIYVYSIAPKHLDLHWTKVPPADQTAWRQLLLPTAQWFPRGYILPTTAAEVSEQSSSRGSAARMKKSGHRGLQLREKQAHTPPMVLELRVRSKPGADFQLCLTLLNWNHSPRYCRREEAHRGQSASPVAELLKFFVEMVNDES